MVENVEGIQPELQLRWPIPFYPVVPEFESLGRTQVQVDEARAVSNIAPDISRPGENEPVHVIRVHSKEAPGKQRFCTVVKHARSLTDKPSIYRKRRERRIGVSQTGAIVGHRVVVVVEAGRNVVRNAGTHGGNQPEAKAGGQLQDTGKIEAMALSEADPPALAPQAAIVHRKGR